MLDQRSATAQVGGVGVSVRSALDDCVHERGPVVAAVSVSVGMDFADLVAALYLWWDGSAPEDYADEGYLRELIVEAVMNEGTRVLTGVRDEITAMPVGVNPRVDFCRARVVQVFGVPAGSDVDVPAPRLPLVGVA